MPFIKETFCLSYPKKAYAFLEDLGFSTKQSQKIIDKGRLRHNGNIVKKSQILQGDIELIHFKAQSLGLEPIFYNDDFCVYDKPHNLLIHPKGLFHHQSLNDCLKSRFGEQANPIHRLDYETSGLVLCALHKKAEVELKNLFSQRAVTKTYTAIVRGIIKQSEMCIDTPIVSCNNGKDLSIRSFVSLQGKPALTQLKVLARNEKNNQTLLCLTPITGRTHQLRVHLNSINHPIIGDLLYGVNDECARAFLESKRVARDIGTQPKVLPLMLNASSLTFSYKHTHFHFLSMLQQDILRNFYTSSNSADGQ